MVLFHRLFIFFKFISVRLRFAIILSVSIAILSTLLDLFRVLYDPWELLYFCLYDLV